MIIPSPSQSLLLGMGTDASLSVVPGEVLCLRLPGTLHLDSSPVIAGNGLLVLSEFDT